MGKIDITFISDIDHLSCDQSKVLLTSLTDPGELDNNQSDPAVLKAAITSCQKWRELLRKEKTTTNGILLCFSKDRFVCTQNLLKTSKHSLYQPKTLVFSTNQEVDFNQLTFKDKSLILYQHN